MTPTHDLAIIGAGPAGSALAAALARAGWQVALLEQRRLPAHKVCGEFLSPESQASLAALGLHDAVVALGPRPMHAARLVSPRGVTLDTPLPGEAWGVSRYALDAALAQAAHRAGADLRQGVTVTGVAADGGHHQLAVRDANGPATLRARAVVVACGRHPLAGLRAGAALGEGGRIGIKQHVVGADGAGRVELYFFPGGYVGVGPVEGDRLNVCLLADRAAFGRGGGRPEALLAAVRTWNPALGERLAGTAAVPDTLKSVAAVDTRRRATPWQAGPRLGDAAVMIPPLCGDGMAMALRGAELLAPLADDYLRGGLTMATWEQAWRKTWHAEFDAPVRTGRALERILAVPGVVDGALVLGRVLPWLARALVDGTRSGGRRGAAAGPGRDDQERART
jgi:flavin-dependent dehydrogenase